MFCIFQVANSIMYFLVKSINIVMRKEPYLYFLNKFIVPNSGTLFLICLNFVKYN